MKKFVNKTKGLIRGTSTAVVLSVAIHAAIFFAAGVWVVFKFIDAQEVKFVPQKIERPKMKLKKLRVKVKDQAKPRKTTQRISSSRKSAVLPPIQLPEMSGMGAGLEGSIGGFEVMADIASMSIFGSESSRGNDLEGTLYHLKWSRSGEKNYEMESAEHQINAAFVDEVNKFLANDWDTAVFDEYDRSPHKIYASYFMLPMFASSKALKIYGMPEDREAGRYVIYYKGNISHPKGGKFRFWATGDDFLFIRINGKLMVDARHSTGGSVAGHNATMGPPEKWESTSEEHMKHLLGMSSAKVSDWFVIKPGESVEMEVFTGEDMGGRTSCLVNIQEFGVEYPENKYGSPILPAFKTAPIPPHVIDELEYLLIPGDTDLHGGPIFGAY